jgi:SHO1 osmosensor
MDNILGDPFALATISIAAVSWGYSGFSVPQGCRWNYADNNLQQLAWFIAFVGSIIATAEHLEDQFPNYSWFAIAYMLCCIVGVFVVIASDTTQTYHVAIVGYLACGLVLTSSSVNSLIYSSNGAKEATAAGHILLSMVNVRHLSFLYTIPYW